MPPPQRRFSAPQTGSHGPLGPLEQQVMRVLWSLSAPASVADVHSALPHAAYSTVKTTLERLTDKGISTRVRHAKAYLYLPAVTEDELERRIVTNALERLVDRFPQAVAAFFVAPGETLSEDAAARLRDAIARRRDAERPQEPPDA